MVSRRVLVLDDLSKHSAEVFAEAEDRHASVMRRDGEVLLLMSSALSQELRPAQVRPCWSCNLRWNAPRKRNVRSPSDTRCHQQPAHLQLYWRSERKRE